MHWVKSTIIPTELEQAKLTLITENTFDIRLTNSKGQTIDNESNE